jgi:hypothetical protein
MKRHDEKTSYFFKPFPVKIFIHICQINMSRFIKMYENKWII